MKETITVLCIRNDMYLDGEPANEINFRVGVSYRCVIDHGDIPGETYDVFNPLDVDPSYPWSCFVQPDGAIGVYGFSEEVRFTIVER